MNKIILLFAFVIFATPLMSACPTANSTITTDFTVTSTDNCFLSGTLELNKNGKTLTVDGSLEITSTFFLTKGTLIVNDTMIIGGSLEMSSNTTLIINGTLIMSSGGNIAANGTITINGTIVLNGGDLDVANGSNTITAGPDGVLINNGSGTVDADIVTALPGSDNCTGGAGECCGSSTACGSALPVELTSFTASISSHGSAILSWTTATEIDNDGFFVQRKVDRGDFENIGFVKGHGTTNQKQSYQFVDPSTPSSAIYRLKQVDFDGQFEYSPVIYAQSKHDQVSIFPNPTSDGKINIVGVGDILDVSITTLHGKVILDIYDASNLRASQLASQALSEISNQYVLVNLGTQGTRQTQRVFIR